MKEIEIFLLFSLCYAFSCFSFFLLVLFIALLGWITQGGKCGVENVQLGGW